MTPGSALGVSAARRRQRTFVVLELAVDGDGRDVEEGGRVVAFVLRQVRAEEVVDGVDGTQQFGGEGALRFLPVGAGCGSRQKRLGHVRTKPVAEQAGEIETATHLPL